MATTGATVMIAGKEYMTAILLNKLALGLSLALADPNDLQLEVEKRPCSYGSNMIQLILQNCLRCSQRMRRRDPKQTKLFAHSTCFCKKFMSSLISALFPEKQICKYSVSVMA